MAAINQKQAVRAIADRMTFRAGALSGERSYWSGERQNVLSPHEGIMSGDTYEQWRADCEGGQITYVVRSYYTPIAWFTTDRGWIVPADKYSVTTSRHQGIVRRALAYEAQFASRLSQALAAYDQQVAAAR